MAKVTRQLGALLGAMVATFFLLWGGADLARVAQVLMPMREDILHVPGVLGVTMDTNAATGATVLRVRLGRVADLMATLDAIRADIPSRLGPYSLALEDRPDAHLDALLRDDAFVVEQGLATGQYVAMQERLLAAGARAHVRTVVEMDSNEVYLALYDASHYRYAVFQKGGLSQ